MLIAKNVKKKTMEPYIHFDENVAVAIPKLSEEVWEFSYILEDTPSPGECKKTNRNGSGKTVQKAYVPICLWYERGTDYIVLTTDNSMMKIEIHLLQI